ncbi:hypothetical protein EV147_4303 [Cupriavidus agavae]|uniref:Uncharacterized protein n=1 Tax=Cupriavidus agavae TaxID=1001822 RepID=A0A4Q7RF14_9BURK|nr:hypothetical protein EV147_4303 [Cupriavidus agavae]
MAEETRPTAGFFSSEPDAPDGIRHSAPFPAGWGRRYRLPAAHAETGTHGARPPPRLPRRNRYGSRLRCLIPPAETGTLRRIGATQKRVRFGAPRARGVRFGADLSRLFFWQARYPRRIRYAHAFGPNQKLCCGGRRRNGYAFRGSVDAETGTPLAQARDRRVVRPCVYLDWAAETGTATRCEAPPAAILSQCKLTRQARIRGRDVRGAWSVLKFSSQKRVRYRHADHSGSAQKRVRWSWAGRLSRISQKRVRRRNGYACRKIGSEARRRRIGYGFGPGFAPEHCGSDAQLADKTSFRTRFCVDKHLPGRREKAASDGPRRLAQKRVRLCPLILWKSLWDQQVIPAESGSRLSLKRVRLAADSGSGYRRNGFGCPQNRVRTGR